MGLEKPDYIDYLDRLSTVSGIKIDCYAALLKALKKRMEFFADMGCVISDHGLKYIMYTKTAEGEVEKIFAKRLSGRMPNELEEAQFKTALLLALAKEYHRLNWVMQLHFGVIRDNSQRIFNLLGRDVGIDCIYNGISSAQLAAFLNALDVTDELPKTILYSLNPTDNAAIGTVIGCFQDSSDIGKIQQGSAWWFNDHRQGIQEQLVSLANLGLLGNFIGMLTDSRSFLSYTRHEYFRRILCELIGGFVENGEYPADYRTLESIIKGISYHNAVRYFGFDLS